jgi:hypothetical protein
MADQIMRAGVETSVIVPEIWSTRFYEVLLQANPFQGLISKDYEGEIANLGDTVKISTVPEFSEAEVIDEDQRANADAVTITQQNLIINKRIVKDFKVTKRSLLQSLPYMDKVRDLAAFSIMKKIQDLIIELTVPTPANALAYDSGTTLGLADILEGKELLDENNVPGTDRFMVMGSAQLNDIFNINGFTSSDFLISGAPLVTGEIPEMLLGFNPAFTTAVGNVTHLFHRSYFTMAAQQGMAVEEFNLGVNGERGSRINTDWLGGFKQLDSSRVVTLS